ncbi:MAG: hypothetical protein LQ348_007182 [Seirophora lacunosa]|nr:MAG: hypothetical protein LQ348_007182 [Seirophora lacunosa]
MARLNHDTSSTAASLKPASMIPSSHLPSKPDPPTLSANPVPSSPHSALPTLATLKRKPQADIANDAPSPQTTTKRPRGRPKGTTKDVMRGKRGTFPKKELRPREAVGKNTMGRKPLAASTAKPADQPSGLVKKGRGRPPTVVNHEAGKIDPPAATKGESESTASKKRGRPAGSTIRK